MSETHTATLKFEGEDHTMGVLLTYILQKMPETIFCAYSIRHPSEDAVYFRLTVKPSENARAVFKKGLNELKKALDVVEKKFNAAVAAA